MKKHFYISVAHTNGAFNFVSDKKKYSETDFNDLLKAKIYELLDDRKDQFESVHAQVTEALNDKKPVTVKDRCFEIKFKKQ